MTAEVTDTETKSRKVRTIFQDIADRYDSASNRISLGRQTAWKRTLTQVIVTDAKAHEHWKLLDVCTGTGDIAIMVAKSAKNVEVTGVDYSDAMLEKAKEKGAGSRQIKWEKADALNLPYEDKTFQAAVISFGLRNTADFFKVLREMKRVVTDGGHIYVMESCVPENPFVRPFYDLYFKWIMPLLGGGIRKFKDYRWLSNSTRTFPKGSGLRNMMHEVGLENIRFKNRMFGACVLVRGQKPLI